MILLNRYGVCDGPDGAFMAVEFEGEEWELDGDDGEQIFGTVLCWPVCATTWIEGMMMVAAKTPN